MGTAEPEFEREIGELHRAYAGALRHFAFTFTADEELCQDAVQEAFLRYFVERRYGRSIANPRAWLYRAVRNYELDHLKGAAVRREVAVERAERLFAQQRDPEAMAERSETAREIVAAMTDRELECLRLRAEGLSDREIGEALVVSCGTVGAVLSRVQAKLRNLGGPGRAWTFAGAVKGGVKVSHRGGERGDH
jgi:RNA polymerase sigma factor (sigma-70 family)